jgi:hypothetical protein
MFSVYSKLVNLKLKYSLQNLISVVQVFGKNQYSYFKFSGRKPSIKEIKVMSYLSYLAGVKGIIYYSLRDLSKQDHFSNRLNKIDNIAVEINQLDKILKKQKFILKKTKVFDNFILQEWKNKTNSIQIIINLSEEKKIFNFKNHKILFNSYEVKILKEEVL